MRGANRNGARRRHVTCHGGVAVSREAGLRGSRTFGSADVGMADMPVSSDGADQSVDRPSHLWALRLVTGAEAASSAANAPVGLFTRSFPPIAGRLTLLLDCRASRQQRKKREGRQTQHHAPCFWSGGWIGGPLHPRAKVLADMSTCTRLGTAHSSNSATFVRDRSPGSVNTKTPVRKRPDASFDAAA